MVVGEDKRRVGGSGLVFFVSAAVCSWVPWLTPKRLMGRSDCWLRGGTGNTKSDLVESELPGWRVVATVGADFVYLGDRWIADSAFVSLPGEAKL